MYDGTAFVGINHIVFPDNVMEALGAPNVSQDINSALVIIRNSSNKENNMNFDQAYDVAIYLSGFLINYTYGGSAIVSAQVAGFMRRSSLTEAWAEKYLEGVKQELGLK